MKKWIDMLSLAALSLGLLTLAPTDASASYGSCYSNGDCQPYDSCCDTPSYCDPCYDACDTGSSWLNFNVAVDFIYWRNCVDGLDVAAIYHQNTNEDACCNTKIGYKRICPSWSPGFRVKLAKPGCWGQWGLSASYTYLNDTEKTSFRPRGGATDGACLTSNDTGRRVHVISPLLHASLANSFTSDCSGETEQHDVLFSHARARYEIQYHTYDVLAAYPCDFCGCHTFTPFFGIGGMDVTQKLGTVLCNPSDVNCGLSATTRWRSCFHAVGLKVGSDYEFRFSECFKLFSKASGTIAAGNPKSHNRQSLERDTNSFQTLCSNDHDDCHIIPGYHLQLGVAYESSFCNTDWRLRLGYEFQKWHNVNNPRRFPNATVGGAAIATASDTTTLGFHGLLAGVEVQF